MAMFDYNRKAAEQMPEASAQKAEQKKEQAKQPVPEEQTQDMKTSSVPGKPVVLEQYPADCIRASVHAGYLRADFPDKTSDTGKGFMFVKPESVRQSVGADGSPIPGKADLTISPDGRQTYLYYVVKDGTPVRSEKQPSQFESEWAEVRQAAACDARKVSVQTHDIQTSQERSVSYE